MLCERGFCDLHSIITYTVGRRKLQSVVWSHLRRHFVSSYQVTAYRYCPSIAVSASQPASSPRLHLCRAVGIILRLKLGRPRQFTALNLLPTVV
jgi:hypothetical protein